MSEMGFRVSSVDRNNHTVHMMVNGCPVTAVCTPNHHPEVYPTTISFCQIRIALFVTDLLFVLL